MARRRSFGAINGGHLYSSSFARLVEKAALAAGRPDATPHTLRHTGASLATSVGATAGGRATTGVLADRLGLSQPTVTHHLGALFDAGFLERERDGRQTWYWVNIAGLQAIQQLLDPAPTKQLLTIETKRK